MAENVLYLTVSVVLSAGRSIFSKKTACMTPGKGLFFRNQMLLFLAAAVLLWAADPDAFAGVSGITVGYGVIYGILLIASQWMYTFAMKIGLTSICSMIYSFGFLFPTLSGVLFWNEPFTVTNLAGLLLALSVILLTFRAGDADGAEKGMRKAFVFSILTAMTASGGLGIMQKIQQSSDAAEEKSAFLILAFLLAFAASGTAYLFRREKGVKTPARELVYPVLTGLCFGGANLMNTVLAGRMKSAVFFPLQNISTILLCTVCGILIFKEKLTVKTVLVLLAGMAAVTVLSL